MVAAEDAPSLLRQLDRALRITKTVELRLDWLAGDSEIDLFLKKLRSRKIRATLIATCRRLPGGGRYRGSIAKQLVHLSEALRAGCSWYDLEIETARKCPPEVLQVLLGKGSHLASAHFFKGLPENLKRVAAELSRARPDAIKIAAHCDTLAESLKLLRLARGRRGVVAVPMGEAALPGRVLALRAGSALAYSAVENVTAPGQVSVDRMKNVYRADQLSGKTRVYGVIGYPIGHSLSPVMQNAGFKERGVDAVFLPFLVRDLPDFLGALKPLGIAGFSVTLPHKQAILHHLDGCDPVAAKIRAVNTVVVRSSGKLYGYNTDYIGVLRTLERRIELRGSRALIVGAGGAARAVAFALEQAGAAVYVCARRPNKAKSLALAVGGKPIARARVEHDKFDVIINTTPLGMHPLADQSPLEAHELNCRLVFDTIYRPQKTKLLRLAEQRGIEIVSGVEMFVAQGIAQWEIWTGERAPEKIMRSVVLDALVREEKGQS